MIAVVVVVAFGFWLLHPQAAAKSPYVTSLQKGEFALVPDACKVVGAPALRLYLSGSPSSIQPISGKTESECTYTVDRKPAFRVLNIMVQAYSPSLTVPGYGSATSAAAYTFASQRAVLAKPPKNTPQPAATISSVAGLGSQAISATQVFHVGAVTDRVTILARYRNVIISVYLSGQASGGFGPVSVGALRSGALAVARSVLAAVMREPRVS